MGYDSDECIGCYSCGGNNGFNTVPVTICYQCFMRTYPSGLRGTSRCSCNVTIKARVMCDVCHQMSVCLYHVSMCPECRSQLGIPMDPPDEEVEHDNLLKLFTP